MKILTRSNILLACILLAACIISCSEPKPQKVFPNVDAMDLGDYSFVRYDRAIADMDTSDVLKAYTALMRKHPILTDLYFKRLLNIEHENLDSFYYEIGEFLKAKEIRMLQDTIEHLYPDTKNIESALDHAFRLMKYYFPEFQAPNVYFMQTEFAYQNIIFLDGERDGAGIGLDMFLTDKFDYKSLDPRNPAFSEYLSRTYTEDHIVRKTVSMLLEDVLGPSNGKRFLDQIIHKGKKLYILENLLAETQDSVIAEFSGEQMEWLSKNELEIWSYFLEHEIIYESNQLRIDKYINPSPHSPGMPPQAPGKTGAYMGWKIVQAYMSRYPETSLKELIEIKDAQKLMELSKYKPKRR